jgi:hypothetical protein
LHARSPVNQNNIQSSIDDSIKADLSEKHQWPYSCYGSAQGSVVENVIVGDYSPEELRMEAYTQQRTVGSIQDYILKVTQLRNYHEEQKRRIIADPKTMLAKNAASAAG